MAGGAALVGVALWRGRRRRGWATSERALGGAALIAGAMLLALLAGMRHPQFRSSDLTLNVHRLEFVQRGDWVFTLALPGPRALEAPYPPAFYAVMLPFAAIVRDKALLVEVTAATAIAAGALVTFALARRVTGADGAALWAAGAYAVAPITYAMASAGNFANLFGQGLANGYLLALALTYGHWRRAGVAAGLTLALTLALLGHFGVFLSLLVALPLLVVVLLFSGRAARGQALALAGSVAVALAAAYALYYHFHTRLLLGYLADALGGQTGARGGAVATLSLAQRLRGVWDAALLWWGWPALPLMLAGLTLASTQIDGLSVNITPNSLLNVSGPVTSLAAPIGLGTGQTGDHPYQFKLTGQYILPFHDVSISANLLSQSGIAYTRQVTGIPLTAGGTAAVNVEPLGWFGLIEMGVFILVLLLGLAYVWRKGLLRWA